MKRVRIRLLTVVVALMSLLATALVVSSPAEATTYRVGVGAWDVSRQRLACNRRLYFDVYFGNVVSHGSDRGITVRYVQIQNFTGFPIVVSANFHNQGGYGGQGHRDLPNTRLGNSQLYTWNVNTAFWFAPTSHTFSSTVQGYNASCGSIWSDFVLWSGPTHY